MKPRTWLRSNLRVLGLISLTALLVASIFILMPGEASKNPLNDALSGGSHALTSLGRSYDSIISYSQMDLEKTRELLQAARASLDQARARLRSAGHTEDEYVLNLIKNYDVLSQSSDAVAQGTENLLEADIHISAALDHYSQNRFEEASKEAVQGLQILTPLIEDLDETRIDLTDLNYQYIPAGQRVEVDQATERYDEAVEIYKQYIHLLESLMLSPQSLETRQELDELFRQLQSAMAQGDYEKAQSLLQMIQTMVENLKTPQHQQAAQAASQLDPSLLQGEASQAARDLKSRLKTNPQLDMLESYLEALQKYMEASELFQQGDVEGAMKAMNEGMEALGEGMASGQGANDPEIERLYTGLTEAFASLEMEMRGEPQKG